jgi:DNA-binding NarL/FixJ family response regulator
MLKEGGILVVGACSTPRELEAVSPAGAPALEAVIVDTDDSAASPAAVAEIRRTYPELKILLLCDAVSTRVVRCAIDERVEGVVLKSDTAEELILALRHVLEGRAVMPVGWQAASREPELDARLARLSLREREVLDLAAGGLSNKEIAMRLTISANTVKFHLRAIYSRLGVHNRVQAAQAVASKQGYSSNFSNISSRGDRAAAPERLSAS